MNECALGNNTHTSCIIYNVKSLNLVTSEVMHKINIFSFTKKKKNTPTQHITDIYRT